MVLQDLQEDKVTDFSKKALHAGAARNKWLKYTLRGRDVLMGRQGYVPLRRLGDVPLIRHSVFHLRLF